MRTAAIYARISSDPDGTRLGVERQIADCEALCQRLGWSVHDLYVDNDTSAWSGKARPEYTRLCDDLKAGTVDALVVWHADRLHRHPRELEEFITLLDAAGDVAVETVTAGELDLGDSTGRVVARILGAVARKESDDKSARLRRKHLELATKGEVSGGGNRPYGFTQDRREVVAEEAGFVREAARRVLAGESVRSVCEDFNQRGVTTSTGGEWSVHTMKRVLVSPRIAGWRAHKGEPVAEAVWPAIITKDESDRLRAALRSGRATRTGRTARRYILTGGLLRCGLCDTPLVSRPRADGKRRYVCAKGPGYGGCGKIATLAEPVEEFITEAVLYRLDTPDLADALAKTRAANNEHQTLADEIADDQAMLDQLAADYATKTISHREWLAARAPIQQRIDYTKRRLSRISPTHTIDDYTGNSAALRDTWADLPPSRQQAIIATVLDHVSIGPAVRGRTTFDPDRLTPTWRL